MHIHRYIENELKRRLIPGKVTVLYGARRVGKTYLLKKLEKELDFKCLWINGEDVYFQEILKERSITNYKRLLGSTELLILDEAQAIKNVGQILKLMVDEIPDLRIIASGSSAFDLNNHLGEPLVGRAYWLRLFPLAQIELKNHENLVETRANLEERLIYGCYPEVYSISTAIEKATYLKSMVNNFLLKDILSFEGIRNSNKVYDLLKLIAYQLGKEVSLAELGRQLGMSKNTVERYLDLLEKVFVLKRINGFSKNLRKEITKNSRWYFWDNGIRNALINDFKTISFRNDIGELWENYLMTERLKKNVYENNFKETFFWRTYDQQEIDCIETQNDEIAAFEFKWIKKQVKAPSTFLKTYPKSIFEVINQDNYLAFIE